MNDVKARILNNKVSIATPPLGDTVWSGNVEFSDGLEFGFKWNRTKNTLKLVTQVDNHYRYTSKIHGVDAHLRSTHAKGDRRKALLEVLYEYEIYWL